MAEKSKWVQIRHPQAHGDDGPIATCLREEFETNLEKKGWVLVGKDGAIDGPVVVPGADEIAEQAQAAEAEATPVEPAAASKGKAS